MGEISLAPLAISFLNDLVDKLYEKEYFGFKESAHDYVDWLEETIYNELPDLTHHKSPAELKRYGKFYVKIQSNKQTMWYVFFDKKDKRFFVELITNNHSPDAAHFNNL